MYLRKSRFEHGEAESMARSMHTAKPRHATVS